jgi:ferritin
MIKERVEKALNEQVNAEIYSAYLYLSMSSYFDSVNLPGFARWMKSQAMEEMVHAMKLYDYVIERGGRMLLGAIEAPPTQWDNPVAAFEATLEHERKVTALINNLVEIALDEKDHATNIFLQWFVSEQVEEEASVDSVLQKLKMIGSQGQGLFMMDRELGSRVPPVGLPAAE